jgi:hypothetical protein
MAPLVSSNLFAAADIAVPLLKAARVFGANSAGAILASILAATGSKDAAAAALSTGLAHLVAPGEFKKVFDTLQKSESTKEGFAELQAVLKVAPVVCDAASGSRPTSDAVAAVHDVPDAVRNSPAFARLLTAAAAQHIANECAADVAATKECFAKVADALKVAVASAEQGAVDGSVGAFVLSGVQVAAFNPDDYASGTIAALFAALFAPAPGALPIVRPEAYVAWAAASQAAVGSALPLVVAEPVGRDVAVEETKGFPFLQG